jgi:peptidoglycan biosynthesis protein MviN/MurJ (putative lipid II flippase)
VFGTCFDRSVQRSALRSGLLTGLAQVALSLAAAGAGALLAHKFGRSAETDGFLAAYAVYTLLVLAAQAFRLVVVPDLTRAAAAGRLGGESRAYAIAFLALAVPVCVLVVVFAHPLGELVTGSLPQTSANVAARALEVLVPAAFVQLLAALAASVLAALDSYGTAALGFGISGLLGLALFAALAGPVGIVALAWALLANALVALAVPVVALVRRGALHGPSPQQLGVGLRLGRLLQGAAVPLALQGCYLIALRLASKLGVGSVTSFTYAYLAASTLVGATGFALGVISSAPLTRRGVDGEAAGRHIVHAAWVSLSFVGAAAGVFALVGGRIVHLVLGQQYAGRVGRDLGLLVVYLSPWMIAWIGFVVAFPLVFVAERRRYLVPVALTGLAAMIPLGLGLRAAWGLPGIAVALGLSTLVTALALMWAIDRRTVLLALAGLARLSLALGAASALAFGALSLALSPIAAAALGVLVYGAIVLSIRSLGLSAGWAYVRGLH